MQQTLDELDFERGLCGASSRGDLSRVQELLGRRERDPNERDTSDYTPLHYAARQGHEEVCVLLLGKRAAVDAIAGEARATPLHRACAAGHVQVILPGVGPASRSAATGWLVAECARVNRQRAALGWWRRAAPSWSVAGVWLKDVHFRGQIASLLLRHGACPSLQVLFLHFFCFFLAFFRLPTAGEMLARDSHALQRQYCGLPRVALARKLKAQEKG